MQQHSDTDLNTDAYSDLPVLLPLDVVARQWHVRPATLRAWARRGVLPSVKIGAFRFFEVGELRRFIRDRRAPGPTRGAGA